MTLDGILLNLRVLSKVTAGGRITRSCVGVIDVEQTTFLSSFKRWLSSDGRQKSVAEIKRIINEAGDKCNSLLNSRHMMAPPHTEEHRAVQDDLRQLYSGLKDSVTGMRNLRITYCRDPFTLAQIDLLIAKVEALLHRVESGIDMSARESSSSRSVGDSSVAPEHGSSSR